MSVLTVSNCLLVSACILLWISMTSSTWRTERGYAFTLWQRCDRHGCVHEVTGFNNYLALVRVGCLFALICLSLAVSGIIVGRFTFMCRRLWQKRAVEYLAACAAISLAPCLALYGFKTVMKGRQLGYPALDVGFALCGIAVMLNLGGSILRAMGPVRTWEDGLSFLLPKDGLLLENRLKYLKYKKRQIRQHQRLQVPLVSMFHDKGNSYYAYASVVSSRSDILRRHSYEEIDIDDMPAPPPELLEPLPPPPPPCPAPRTRDISQIPSHSHSTFETISTVSVEPPRRPKRNRKQYYCSSLHKENRNRHGSPSASSSRQELRYHTMPVRALQQQ